MPNLVMCGIPRSGSTLVWQIMSAVFPHRSVLHTHPAIWQWDGQSRVLGSVRNPYDVAASLYRVRLSRGGENVDGVEGLMAELGWLRKNFQSAMKIYKNSKAKNGKTIIRYEDFVHNYDVIYDAICALTGANVTRERRDQINEQFSLDANRARAAKLQSFNERDEHDIHGDHIGAVEPGTWAAVIPEWGHATLREWCEPLAKEWGYA